MHRSVLVLGLVVAMVGMSACSSDKPDAEFSPAPWARDITAGSVMWTVTQDGWTVTAYEMGRAEAYRDGSFSDDTTDEPLVRQGDAIVFVNLVATNTSEATMFVGIDEPRLWASPADPGYAHGVAGLTPATDEQMSEHGVWYHSRKIGAEGSTPFAVAPGESFAMGFVLPLVLSEHGEWLFVGSVRVYDAADAAVGEDLRLERQSYTFS